MFRLVAAAMIGLAMLPPAAAGRNRALWVWDAAPLLADRQARAEFLAFCAREGIGRAWIQVAVEPNAARLRDSDRWRELLAEAHASGLAVDALDGSPEYVLPRHRDAVVAVVHAVVEFNRGAPPSARFDGIHMDNEPHVLAGWHDPATREQLLLNLVEVSAAMQSTASAHGLAFGIDMPFWWQTIDEETKQPIGAVTFRGQRKPASFHLLDLVDNAGIMNYRNTAEGGDGIIAHARPLLTYADATRAKVFVGVETTLAPPTPYWFVSGVDKQAFRKLLALNSSSERRDLAIVDHGRQVIVGTAVGGDDESNEQRLGVAAQTLGARVLDDEGRRIWNDARAALANQGEWRDLARAPIIDRQGRAYGGWRATQVMQPKLTFAGKSNAEMSRELETADRALSGHRSYAGIAVHDYAAYRLRFAAPR